jgi:hypothetical protein
VTIFLLSQIRDSPNLEGQVTRVRVRVTLRLAVYRQSVRLGAGSHKTHGQNFLSQLNTCGHRPYITSSLTRGWVCHFQLLLALASAFILGSESRVTGNHILLSQIRYFPFCRLLRLAGLRWRYSTPPLPGMNWIVQVKVVKVSQSHIATDDRSICKWLMTRYLLLFDSHGIVFVGRPLWR